MQIVTVFPSFNVKVIKCTVTTINKNNMFMVIKYVFLLVFLLHHLWNSIIECSFWFTCNNNINIRTKNLLNTIFHQLLLHFTCTDRHWNFDILDKSLFIFIKAIIILVSTLIFFNHPLHMEHNNKEHMNNIYILALCIRDPNKLLDIRRKSDTIKH